jgi:hypothetical protein
VEPRVYGDTRGFAIPGTSANAPSLIGKQRSSPMNDDPVKPTTETERPNLSTEHQRDGDARRPSDTLDKGQPSEEHIPRKSSLLGD